MDLSEGEDARSVGGSSRESNDSICFYCRGGGEVVCCEGCTNSFHVDCLDAARRPQLSDEDWFCPECVARSAASKGAGGGLPASSFLVGMLPSPPCGTPQRFLPPAALYAAAKKDDDAALSPLLLAKRRKLHEAAPLAAAEASHASSSSPLAPRGSRESSPPARRGGGDAGGRPFARETERDWAPADEAASPPQSDARDASRADATHVASATATGPEGRLSPKREPHADAAAAESPAAAPPGEGRASLLGSAAAPRAREGLKEEESEGSEAGSRGGPPASQRREKDDARAARAAETQPRAKQTATLLSSPSSPSSAHLSAAPAASRGEAAAPHAAPHAAASPLEVAASPPLQASATAFASHAFLSANCRAGAGGRWPPGAAAGGASKRRRKRGDETRINVGPDYQVPRLPDFYLSRSDELASAEEAYRAMFPFSTSWGSASSLFVSSAALACPSVLRSLPSTSSFFALQDTLRSRWSPFPCSLFPSLSVQQSPRGTAGASEPPRAAPGPTRGEDSDEKAARRAGAGASSASASSASLNSLSLAAPTGAPAPFPFFAPAPFEAAPPHAPQAFPPPPGFLALTLRGAVAAAPALAGIQFEDARHSALEPRLVYSPRHLEEKRQQCIATGRLQHCIRTQTELADFVETCSRCWHARPGWQPFSAEFAYQLLHRAGYDPQRALRMLDDPGFCFNDICEPPLRKYDNKWKRRDKRGTFPNSPYPPPLVIQAFLQEKSRGATRPSSSSALHSVAYLSR
ncbi:PHD-finger domain-containing protein [Besnoitia besnoiti]|uniref:PHD-finger domain-containing protein n=1 Tax=Besnoitia besnoiti TaxID=94643 RepID=A0A2A9ML07_BESBE|nr:PHD-finger domain-containing protein [Besnoitia besnoiti]PFH38695.1 PHD-finger domain-containing protein [Besnoitia besnoiti]